MRTDLFLFAAGVLLVVCCNTVSGATSFAYPSVEIENGRPVGFCAYRGMRLLPGSFIADWDQCENCTCSLSGLSCQSSSGRIFVNDPDSSECRVVRSGCQNFWVMKDDIREDCPPHMIPQHGMVGK